MPRRAHTVALALVGMLVVTAGTASTLWQTLKLSEFTFSAPSNLVHKVGGIDSQAGTLSDSKLQISYDYGAYSDTLTSVEGAVAFKERTGFVDGLASRFVSFTRLDTRGQNQACEGVHVPLVRKSAIGSIKLTMLLCGDAKKVRATADKLFASIKFQADASR